MTSSEQLGAPAVAASSEIDQLLVGARQAAAGLEQIAILEQVHEALRQQLTVASRD